MDDLGVFTFYTFLHLHLLRDIFDVSLILSFVDGEHGTLASSPNLQGLGPKSPHLGFGIPPGGTPGSSQGGKKLRTDLM